MYTVCLFTKRWWLRRFGCRWYMSSQDAQSARRPHSVQRTRAPPPPHNPHDAPASTGWPDKTTYLKYLLLFILIDLRSIMYITVVFIINIEIKLWTLNKAQQIVEERNSLIIKFKMKYIWAVLGVRFIQLIPQVTFLYTNETWYYTWK